MNFEFDEFRDGWYYKPQGDNEWVGPFISLQECERQAMLPKGKPMKHRMQLLLEALKQVEEYGWEVKQDVPCDDGTTNDVVVSGDGWLYIQRYGNHREAEQDMVDLIDLIGMCAADIIALIEAEPQQAGSAE